MPPHNQYQTSGRGRGQGSNHNSSSQNQGPSGAPRRRLDIALAQRADALKEVRESTPGPDERIIVGRRASRVVFAKRYNKQKRDNVKAGKAAEKKDALPEGQFIDATAAVMIMNEVKLGLGPMPILVSIDLEFYEFDASMTLEVGMAILDTQDVKLTDPGDRASNWIRSISYHHFLIKEKMYITLFYRHDSFEADTRHRHKKNGKWCQGHPDKFLFGQTVIASSKEIATQIESIIQVTANKVQNTRPLLLVGHAFANDDKALRNLGFSSWPPPNTAGILDTQRLASSILPRRFPGHPGLGVTLKTMGIASAYLHNGGNDAAFTLQALLSLLHLTDEQKSFLQPIPPELSQMTRSWSGNEEPQDPQPSKKRAKFNKTTSAPNSAPATGPNTLHVANVNPAIGRGDKDGDNDLIHM